MITEQPFIRVSLKHEEEEAKKKIRNAHPCTVSGLILATANDEILIFVYHSVQRLEEKNWWNKILNYNSLSFNSQVLMVYWGRYLALTLETRVQFPAQYFLFFSTFTLFCPFLEIFKGQKRGAYTTIYQWDQVQSTRILLYFYQN